MDSCGRLSRGCGMGRAISFVTRVVNAATVGKLRFVMIDEFQDFSKMFFEMIAAIRSINTRVHHFCVGDDWQAINAFAGSDIGFFENFDRYFQHTSTYYIRTNF